MILKKLKEETKERHNDLENTVNIMSQMFSPEAYKVLLCKFYRFYAAIEPKLAALDWKKVGYNFDERSKLPNLEKDLQAFGLLEKAKSEVLSSGELPSLDSFAEGFGSVYVLEGATLGGQVITRHLKQNFDLTPENGGAFFNSYGPEVGKKWKEFGAAITAFAEKNQDDETIVESARQTFDSFRDSFLRPLSL